MDRLAILLLSYNRVGEALRTIEGICANLVYRGEIGWYVADDGTDVTGFNNIVDVLEQNHQIIIGAHNQRFSPNTGVGWNRGLGICHQYSDYVMVMEDDWELTGSYDMNPDNHPGKFCVNPYIADGKFNIDPYMEMLSQREDVGLVRLGGLAVGNNVSIVGHNGHHYLKYIKDRPYGYSGNPQIRHARFTRAYGIYSEAIKNPGELEIDLDQRFLTRPGPDIWRPADIPAWGIFHHIGQKRFR